MAPKTEFLVIVLSCLTKSSPAKQNKTNQNKLTEKTQKVHLKLNVERKIQKTYISDDCEFITKEHWELIFLHWISQSLEDLTQRQWWKKGEGVLKSIRKWFKTSITSGMYSQYITCQGVYANKCLEIYGSGYILCCFRRSYIKEVFCLLVFSFCWLKKTKQKNLLLCIKV